MQSFPGGGRGGGGCSQTPLLLSESNRGGYGPDYYPIDGRPTLRELPTALIEASVMLQYNSNFVYKGFVATCFHLKHWQMVKE